MRILHVYKDYHPIVGGIENHVRDLALEQARRGHDVTVLVTNTERHDEVGADGPVRVVRAGRWAKLQSTPISTSLFGWIARLERDVTHLHFPYPMGELAQLLRGPRGPVIVTYHGDIVRQATLLKLYDPFLRAMLKRADRILATSPNYVRSSPYLAAHAHKVEVVPLGVDIARFENLDEDGVRRLHAHLAPAGETLLLMVGRMRYYKGLDVAIDALDRVRDLPLRLALVGDGEMRPALERQVARLGLSGMVTFADSVGNAELPLWYRAADVYVSSSSHRSEAFGISIVEALASGRPALTTELGTGTSWVNQHDVTGLVVPANDPAALAGAMRTLALDPARRAAMGRAAHARARAEFTLDTMNDRVIAIYEAVLGPSGPVGAPARTQDQAAR